MRYSREIATPYVFEQPELRSLSMIESANQDIHHGWSRIVATLHNWMLNPTEIENEDGESPSKMTIRRAQACAINLEEAGSVKPIAVVPGANGGILFEWRLGSLLRSIEIMPGGEAEEILVRNGRLRSRTVISLEANRRRGDWSGPSMVIR